MKYLSNQNGFSYIFALTVVMIMGVMLGMAGQSWQALKQRELEEELIYRGDQVAEVVYQRSLCMGLQPPQNLWPIADSANGTVLDDLVIGREERCPSKGGMMKKYRLRKSSTIDPMTGKQWKIVTYPGDATRFAGVASTSEKEPFRKSFKNIYDTALLDDKKQYSDWTFTIELKKPALQSAPRNTR